MTWKLMLDDLRNLPVHEDFVAKYAGAEIARTVEAAIALIEERGCPSFISFDHDLGYEIDGRERNGADLARWLIDAHLDSKLQFPEGFECFVHSANPSGAMNILGLLNGYYSTVGLPFQAYRVPCSIFESW